MRKLNLKPGQSWIDQNGLIYTIAAEIDGGFKVEISVRTRAVTANTEPWLFTETKLQNLITGSKMKVYDPRSVIDSLAEKLEHKGHLVLATELDEIGNDYVTARQPGKLQEDRVRQAEEQLITLKQQLKEAVDPENRERLNQEIWNIKQLLNSIGDRTKDVQSVPPTPGITQDEIVTEPDFVSKP